MIWKAKSVLQEAALVTFDGLSINYFFVFFQRELFQSCQLLLSLLPMAGQSELAPLVFLSAIATTNIGSLK